MHPEVTSDGPGSCPKCGMNLVPPGEAGEHTGHGHGDHNGHSGHSHAGHGSHKPEAQTAPQTYTCPMHPEVTSDGPGSCPKCGMDLVARDAGENGHPNHAGAGAKGGQTVQGGHEGHGPAPDIPGIEPHFMSMAALTDGKPASPDGLVMEWIDVPFGPFFPGLPGALELKLTLDGDSVVRAKVSSLAAQALPPGLGAADLPDRLAALSPLAPVGLRELACRALEAAAGHAPGDGAARAAAVERERLASHLGWLVGLARQSGLVWLERRASALLAGLRVSDPAEVARRAPAIRALADRVGRAPLMRDRLANVGRIDRSAAEAVGGPVARASGNPTDAREQDDTYAALGFQPLTQTAGDARARLSQRLAEIGQGLDLIARAGAIALAAPPAPLPMNGHGMATVETPRGPATLHLNLKDGAIETLHLSTPFAALAELIGPMTEQMELAEALTAVSSLDLDPWGTGA